MFKQDTTEVLTARAVRELNVQPSLDIRPIVRPSNSPSTPFLLVLETLNLALPSDVKITQISSISPKWKCKLLDGFSLKDDLDSIAFQQSNSVCLAIEPVDSIVNKEEVDFVAEKLDSLLQGREIKGSSPSEISLHVNSLSSVSFLTIGIS